MTGSVTGIRRRRGVAGRRETPHLPLDRDFYGQTLFNKGKNERRPIMASIKPKLKYHLIWTCVDGTTPVPSQA